MNLIFRKAERKQAKIKLALQGTSGSGKTYSALLLAHGMTNDWSKIAIIDTENGSADLYAHLGDYFVLPLSAPFSPERYIQAINLCIQNKIEVIIIDSISHCWDHLIEYHNSLQGNSFTNWGKVTPRHKTFVESILQCDAHVIATMRTKQDYVLNEKNGKHIPEKVGLKAIQRDGLDYEFTVVFDIDLNHLCRASKDRTSLFIGKPEFIITTETGQLILNWCNSGTTADDVRQMIENCEFIEELNDLYRSYPELYPFLEQEFKAKKQEILESFTLKQSSNGIASIK